MIVDIPEVEFEFACGYCYASGTYKGKRCTKCDGSGYLISDLGLKLLEFLKRHQKPEGSVER